MRCVFRRILGPWSTSSPTITERLPVAKQIADASYDHSIERLQVTFRDGTIVELGPTAMTKYGITAADYAAPLAAGRWETETEFRAQAVRYVADQDAVAIMTIRNAGFLIPLQWIGALQEVPTEDLAKLEVWSDGSAIAVEERDIHISVHGLMVAVLPVMLPPRVLAAIFASRGGKATSDAKRRSAQANGRKGGRPRKAAKTEAA